MSTRRRAIWPAQTLRFCSCAACRTHRRPALWGVLERTFTVALLTLAGVLTVVGLFGLGLLVVAAMTLALEGLDALARLLGRL
jgi:hypothetical protein